MSTVYLPRLRLALPMLVRASALHVGAAAAAASLRQDLVDAGQVSEPEFNRCYAVARLTPGTNLLALYVALGYQIAAFRGALGSLAIGAIIPTLIAVTTAAFYVQYAAYPFIARFMAGARAGTVAVFLWAAVRLMRPAVGHQRARLFGVAVATVVLSAVSDLSPFFALLLAGGVSVFLLAERQ